MKKVRLFTLGLLGLLFVEQTMAMRHLPGEDFPFPLTTLVEGQPPPLYLFDLPIVPDTEPLADSVFGRVSTWLASMDPATRFTRVEALKLELSERASAWLAEAIAYQLSLFRFINFPVQVEVTARDTTHLIQRGHVPALDLALNMCSLRRASQTIDPLLQDLRKQKLTHALSMPNNPSVVDLYTLFTRDPILGQQILLLRYIGVDEEGCMSALLAHALAAGEEGNIVGRVGSRVRGIRGSWAVETPAIFPVLMMNGDRMELVNRPILFVLWRSVVDDITYAHLATAFSVSERGSRIIDRFSPRSLPSDFATFFTPELEDEFSSVAEEDPTIAGMIQVQEARYDTFDALQQEIDNALPSDKKGILLRAWYGQCLLSRDGLSLGQFLEMAIMVDVPEILQDVGSLMRSGLLLKRTVDFRECACSNPFVSAFLSRNTHTVRLLCDLFPELIDERCRVSRYSDGRGDVRFAVEARAARAGVELSLETTPLGVAIIMASMSEPRSRSNAPLPPHMERFFEAYKRIGCQSFYPDSEGFVSPVVMAVLGVRPNYFKAILSTNTDLRNLLDISYNFGRPEFKLFCNSSVNINQKQTLPGYMFDRTDFNRYELICCASMLEHVASLGGLLIPRLDRQSLASSMRLGEVQPYVVASGCLPLATFMQVCKRGGHAAAEIKDLVDNGFMPIFFCGLQVRPWTGADRSFFESCMNKTSRVPEMAERFQFMKRVLETSYSRGRIADRVMTGSEFQAHKETLDQGIAACSPAPAVAASVAAVSALPAAG
ncbi:MAG: hypothetical protein LBJ70_00060 [Holosporales bacterium]|jgi:hypothetical protein|nr:hypothetical protein [Holosporales bacterium]